MVLTLSVGYQLVEGMYTQGLIEMKGGAHFFVLIWLYVYPCLLEFTYFYSCLSMITHVYLSLPIFTPVYQ